MESTFLGAVVASSATPNAILGALQHSLVQIMEEARARRDMATETLERYNEINQLYHLGETIGSIIDIEDIPEVTLQETVIAIQGEASAVYLADDQGNLTLRNQAGLPGFVERMFEEAQSTLEKLLNRNDHDVLTRTPTDDFPIAHILVAPMKASKTLHGVILVGRRFSQPMFTAGDGKLVMAIARQAAIAKERTLLVAHELERKRMEEELAVGRQIQLSLLPQHLPDLPGWEFAAIYETAGQVGGDLYDFFTLPTANGGPSQLGLVIADVTGKGVPAALFMAFSRTVLRSVSMTGKNPADVLTQANHLIFSDNRSQLFLTAFYAKLNPQTGELVYANGGHGWPLWLQAKTGEAKELSAKSFVIGAVETVDLEEHNVTLQVGDLVVFSTDGVTEAMNVDGELFGEDRLRTVIEAHPDASAESMLEAIIKAVWEFKGDAELIDDFTLYVMKRTS